MDRMRNLGGMVEQQRRLEFRCNFVGIDWTLPAKTVAIDGRNFAAGQRHPALSGDRRFLLIFVILSGNVAQLINGFVVGNREPGNAAQAGTLSRRALQTDGPVLEPRAGQPTNVPRHSRLPPEEQQTPAGHDDVKKIRRAQKKKRRHKLHILIQFLESSSFRLFFLPFFISFVYIPQFAYQQNDKIVSFFCDSMSVLYHFLVLHHIFFAYIILSECQIMLTKTKILVVLSLSSSKIPPSRETKK